MAIQNREVLRYAINGIVATAAHYSVLFSCLELLNLHPAGLVNLLASSVGITLSFLGNRYFVFCSCQVGFLTQAAKFAGLYSVIALVHGVVLFLWTDRLGLNYNIGFVIAVTIQFLMGYFGGRRHVFNRINIDSVS